MRRLTLISMLLALVLALAACGGTMNEETHDDAGEQGESGGHSEGEAEHDDEGSIPNDGAVIRIVSPDDGQVFKTTDEILVQVEVENFALGEDGRHWHVHIDGGGEVMVMGGNTDQPLRNLEPGEHTLEVRMSTGDHQDLAEGDAVTITVEQ